MQDDPNPYKFQAGSQDVDVRRILDDAVDAQKNHQPEIHTCPITGEDTPTFDPRFPNTIAQGAVLRAVDSQGRQVTFFNAGMSGGLIAHHINADQTYEEDDVIDCWIDGVACKGVEFHMGGTGIVPLA